MTSFADSWEFQELLAISKQARESVDSARVWPHAIAGIDNWNHLRVSTVFAAISIEAALNDYVLFHCLFVETPYLQSVFGEITKSFLRSSWQHKLKLVNEHWPDKFPSALLTDIRRLFEIRNAVTHQTGRFTPARSSPDSTSRINNNPPTNDDMQHMLRHHEIAHDFLSRFWVPGTREVGQPAKPPRPDDPPEIKQVELG